MPNAIQFHRLLLVVLLLLPAVEICAQVSGEGQNTTTPANTNSGYYDPQQGFVVASDENGELVLSLWTYIRYLNQKALDHTYTDAFGRTRDLRLRQDFQVNKVMMYLKGWFFEPRLRYSFYVWTSNPTQGLPAHVVVSGFLRYQFSPKFTLNAGVGALPSTRTTLGTFPYWLKVDHRSIADEFFRGSFTAGVWIDGKLAQGLKYRLMAGNNLSQMGVDAERLDNEFNTVSGSIWWMPTTGEFGPNEGYGDFESHEDLATLFGLHFTRSREDRQDQPGQDAPENTQIRLSDGTGLFSLNAFGPETAVTQATYRMLSAEAGFKYKGFSVEGEYFARWVDDFSVIGPVPVSRLFDDGSEIQASAMLKPQTLQAYVAGSKIFGEFGNPWDLSVGLNWFPYKTRNFRINGQALYLRNSPVGYLSVPFVLGGNGVIFSVDTEFRF